MGKVTRDWASRRVLSWRVSNSMEADFCIEALEAALACLADRIPRWAAGHQMKYIRQVRPRAGGKPPTR
jgi:transposase InsO family protein